VITATFQWGSKEDDEAVYRASKNIIDRSIALGKEMGLHHPYIYQNHAAGDQDVFGEYPAKNRDKLRCIKKKYDPDGVFSSRLNPGYFKV
jgi:FAD/FMN-containing dehydrogenase